MILVDTGFLIDLGIVGGTTDGSMVSFYRDLQMTTETIKNFKRFYELATIDGQTYGDKVAFYKAIGVYYSEPDIVNEVTFMRNATFDGVNPIGDFVTYYKGMVDLLSPTLDQTPIEIFGSDLHTWINADRSDKTLTGNLIDQIDDLSGNGNHMDEGFYLRPELVTNEYNGKPVIRFNGTDQALMSVKPSSEYTFLSDGTKCAVYAIVKITERDANNYQPILGTAGAVGGNASGYNFYYENRSSQSRDHRLESACFNGSGFTKCLENSSENNVFGTRRFMMVGDRLDLSNATPSLRSDTKLNFYDKSDNNALSNACSGSDPHDTFQLAVNDFNGSKQHSKIDIAEIIIVEGEVSDAQEEQLRTYFINEWGQDTESNPVTVLNIGDSISRGTSTGLGVATAGTLFEWKGYTIEDFINDIYRANSGTPYPSMGDELFTLSSRPLYNLNFGSNGSEFAPNGDNNNWSSTGDLYDQMKAGADAFLTFTGDSKFDIIRITCGINDVGGSTALATIESDMQDLIDRLNVDFPNTTIIINQLGENPYDAGRYSSVRGYIDDLITNNSNVYAAKDLSDYPVGYYFDGLHLNQTGNDALGVDDATIIDTFL